MDFLTDHLPDVNSFWDLNVSWDIGLQKLRGAGVIEPWVFCLESDVYIYYAMKEKLSM